MITPCMTPARSRLNRAKILTAALFTAAMMSVGAPPAAAKSDASILGTWATGTAGGKVEIYRCGNAFCGKIVDAARLRTDPDYRDYRNSNPNLRDRKLKGLVVLQNFEGGPIRFKGGPVYDPESGDGAARGELALLSAEKLEVKGCVAFFCRAKTWTRIR